MKIIETLEKLGEIQGGSLVPTMGALHEGHASLIRAGAASDRPVLVTLFVNPTQFAPNEDFAKYPRTLDADLKIAEAAGASAVFVPSIEAIYPGGLANAASLAAQFSLPPIATAPRLEDAVRPTHFGGVCLVVSRLFDLCQPSLAYFGEKDFQQLRVITQMVEENSNRWKSLKIIPCATIREPDGLAMSSRNRYLDPSQRIAALGISRALQSVAHCSNVANGEALMRKILDQHGLETQYAVIRSEKTLCAPESGVKSARALIAAKLGAIRLIDNAIVGISTPNE
ncbi:MAG: pantoate--beta-alanine ligase [Planctomycetota bacterium]|nr:pantoate--beta-alanine ligase [Planctomycetota bacterium]